MIDSIKKGNTLSKKDISQLVALNASEQLSKSNGSIENVLFYGKKGPVFPRTDVAALLPDSIPSPAASTEIIFTFSSSK